MSAVNAAEPRAGWPKWASLRSPAAVGLATTVPGRLVLLVIAAALLRPVAPQWPAIVACAAAVAFSDRRRAMWIALAGTAAATVFWPDWYGDGAAMQAAPGAGMPAGIPWHVKFATTCIVLAFCAGFLALVRSGRPAWISRRPFATLLALMMALVIGASSTSGAAQFWLWEFASAFSGYIWALALIAGEQRSPAARTPFLEQFVVLHPLWGSTGVPYAVAPKKLRRLTAADGAALVKCQLRGLQLLLWGDFLLIALMAYGRIVHGQLGILSSHDAIVTYAAGNLPWSMRWMSLISDFFEAILKISVMGHAIIGGARLVGYDLPRNTYRPFESRTLIEFWGRYYYYFKELMLTLFYFPTFFACFRNHPRLRAVFATFMAAGVGNWLFHFLRELPSIAEFGLWPAIMGMRTYAVYCLLLAGGIAISQLRARNASRAVGLSRGRIVGFLVVMLFYCLLQVFDDTSRTSPLGDHARFFVSLFLPWSS